MLEKLAHRIAYFYIEKGKIQEAQKEIYFYCFEIMLSTFINFIFLIALALLTNTLIPALIFSIYFIPLRSTAGGLHAKTHLGCVLTLLSIYTLLIILLNMISAETLSLLGIILVIISIIIIFLLAPVDCKNKRLSQEEISEQKHKSRILLIIISLSFILVAAFNIILNAAFVIGYTVFSVSILMISGKIQNKLL